MSGAGRARHRPPRARLAVAASVGAVGLVTLWPTGDEVAPLLELCLVCGSRGSADALLNVLLFVPLGFSLASAGLRLRSVVLLGFLLSAVVESLQIAIPGRDPSVGDLVFNTVGAAAGAALAMRRGLLIAPAPALGRWLAGGAALAALAALGIGTVLLRSTFPDAVYFGQWTARFPHLQPYDGQVLAAEVGGVRVPGWRIARRSALVRDKLIAGEPIVVDFVAGSATTGLAPIFSIYDDRTREVVLVGVDGDELVFRRRTLAGALRFDQPDLRAARLLRGLVPGDTARITIAVRGAAVCMGVNADVSCTRGWTAGDTWGLLMYPPWLTPPVRAALRISWVLLLFVPAGYWARARDLAVLGPLVIGGLALIGAAPTLLPTPLAEFGAAALGLGAGHWLGRRVRRVDHLAQRIAPSSSAVTLSGGELLHDDNAARGARLR